MLRQPGHISKTLLFLAAILVPFQQSIAASCCCQMKLGVQQAVSSSGGTCCCSGKRTASGSSAKVARQCCQSSRTVETSSSAPCHCPGGSCGKRNPEATEPAAPVDFTVHKDLQPLDAVPGEVLLIHNASTAFSNRTVVNSQSGADLCILLCRYAL